MDKKKKKKKKSHRAPKVFIWEQSDMATTRYVLKEQKGTKIKLCFVDVMSGAYSASWYHKKSLVSGGWPVCRYIS